MLSPLTALTPRSLPFPVSSVPGMGFGYDTLAEITTGLTAQDGQTVQRLLDRSGNGIHANSATAANRPAWAASLVNGQPGFVSDGSNDNFLLPNTVRPFVQNVPGMTLIVAGALSTTVPQDLITIYTALGGARFQAGRSNTGQLRLTVRRLDAVAAVSTISAAGVATTGWEIDTYRYDPVAQTVDILRNGTNVSSSSGVLTSGNIEDTLSQGVYIVGNSTTNPASGSIAALYYWPFALTAAQMRAVQRGLGTRYDIAVA